MSTELIDCPDCKDNGVYLTAFLTPNGDTDVGGCKTCNGSTKVGAYHKPWIAAGAEMRNQRVRQRLTLRDASRMHGIAVDVLSQMERGIIEPDHFEYKTATV